MKFNLKPNLPTWRVTDLLADETTRRDATPTLKLEMTNQVRSGSQCLCYAEKPIPDANRSNGQNCARGCKCAEQDHTTYIDGFMLTTLEVLPKDTHILISNSVVGFLKFVNLHTLFFQILKQVRAKISTSDPIFMNICSFTLYWTDDAQKSPGSLVARDCNWRRGRNMLLIGCYFNLEPEIIIIHLLA